MAARVRHPGTAPITTIFVCLHSRSIMYGSRQLRHAERLNARPASLRLARLFSSAGIRGSPNISIDEVICIAKQHNIDASHPGYGFLSESPEFAEAYVEAGTIVVGPSAQTKKLAANYLAFV